RVSRLEQRHGGGNPLDDLTDEELEEAIEALNQRMADALGSTSADVAAAFVDVPCDLSDEQLRALAARIKGGSLV
ncbi:hypothetical protein, partial [Mesorhizobium marinum]